MEVFLRSPSPCFRGFLPAKDGPTGPRAAVPNFIRPNRLGSPGPGLGGRRSPVPGRGPPRSSVHQIQREPGTVPLGSPPPPPGVPQCAPTLTPFPPFEAINFRRSTNRRPGQGSIRPDGNRDGNVRARLCPPGDLREKPARTTLIEGARPAHPGPKKCAAYAKSTFIAFGGPNPDVQNPGGRRQRPKAAPLSSLPPTRFAGDSY